MEIAAIDLFCGAGGLTHGLEKAGIPVAAGFDADPECEYPYESNNRARFILSDLEKAGPDVAGKELEKASVKVVTGCAPCQPFSTYTRDRGCDGRAWALVPVFGHFVEQIRPDIVVMENVTQLARHEVFRQLVHLLQSMDYFTLVSEVECAHFGVPQTRRRLTLLASLLGDMGTLQPSHAADSPVTVRDAIGGGVVPALAAGQISEKDALHRACRLCPVNLRRIHESKPGGTWRDWPEELRAPCHRKETGTTYPSVYGRMEWDKPAPTITTQCFGYGNGRFGHPDQNRAITLREAAILQTFEPDYNFVPAGQPVRFSVVGRLIGNAVPPRLGMAIGRAILRHLAEVDPR